MIRLGLRLTLNGGKEAAVRLAIIVGAVALGVGLLLVALAGMNAINAQNARSAWLNTGSVFVPGPASPGGAAVRAARCLAGRWRVQPVVVAVDHRLLQGPRPSTGSTWPPPARTLPFRPACPTCPARASSTPLRP